MNTEKTIAPRVHHPYSPSKLQPLESCAKYESAQSDNEAAVTGTLQHDMAETGEDNLNLPDYRALAVVECLKFVDERKREMGPGFRELKEIYLPLDDEEVLAPAVYTETLLDAADPELGTQKVLTRAKANGTTAGYVDVALINKDLTYAEIIDYKYGQWAVEKAENNLQGIAYLLGLKRLFPKLKRGAVWFIMPHRDEISGAEFDLEKNEGRYLRIRAVVKRAEAAHADPDDFSMANHNESACRFCANLGRCPKVAEVVLKVGKKYRPLEIPESISTSVFTDPEQVRTGLALAAIVKTWAEAYRTQATNKTVDDPKFIPDGYDLVSMTKRSVKDARRLVDLAKDFLPEELKLKAEGLFEVSLGPIEKLISTAAPRGQKEKTVDEFSAKALSLGHVEEGTPYAFLRQKRKSSKD